MSHASGQRSRPTVSVIVDNYDNADLLPAAIDSVLRQTVPPAEIVVVDDGSTDGSPAVIAAYAARSDDRVVPVLKPNGGQASAFNAAYPHTTGAFVIFLDSDDVLHPTAIETVVASLGAASGPVARVQWPMTVIDRNGVPTGEVVGTDLEAGELADRVLTGGPFSYGWSSTSGNAWSRRCLDAILPMPEDVFRLCPDIYLSTLAPLFGEIVVTPTRSSWRRHDANGSRPTASFDDRLRLGLQRFEACLVGLRSQAGRSGLELDVDRWRDEAWFHRLARAVATITSHVPADGTILLADEDAWEVTGDLAGRRVRPFLEQEGVSGGPPADDEHALAELDRMRRQGATHLAVGWPAGWWLEHYRGFFGRLDAAGARLVATRDVTVYVLT
jgi:glycosyltransferase involved in cell wall biosynthesis